jgi:hypothetical protein
VPETLTGAEVSGNDSSHTVAMTLFCLNEARNTSPRRVLKILTEEAVSFADYYAHELFAAMIRTSPSSFARRRTMPAISLYRCATRRPLTRCWQWPPTASLNLRWTSVTASSSMKWLRWPTASLCGCSDANLQDTCGGRKHCWLRADLPDRHWC